MKVAIPWGPWIDPERIRPYVAWLHAGGASVVKAERVEDLRKADGLLLPGGPDVWPRYYGEVNRFPDRNRLDQERDFLEMAFLERALERDLPLLAICRGVQVLNVFLGGTLYQDLPSEYPSPVLHRRLSPEDPLPRHPVLLVPEIPEPYRLEARMVDVNSSHHQAIRRLASPLVEGGRAPDGVVEMVWLADATFGLGVQWHPERDPEDPVSHTLRLRFLDAGRSRGVFIEGLDRRSRTEEVPE